MSIIDSVRSKPKLWVSASLLSAGLASGVYLGGTLTSGAATTSSSTAASSTATGNTASGNTASGNTSTGDMPTPPGAGSSTGSTGSASGPPAGAPTLPKSGTVTAVGASSVTIDGTTYAATSSSDIDKNGEATLSSLAVGDTVTFSTLSTASSPTIDKLHAGNEALDRPTGPPSSSSGHLPPNGQAPNGQPPTGQAPASGQSSSAAA